ncbi:MAG: DUF58 domain-containing protein [Acidimicrobiales bacterium]
MSTAVRVSAAEPSADLDLGDLDGLDAFGPDGALAAPARAHQLESPVELSPGARVNTPTPLFFANGLLALCALAAALVLQRPELLALGTPALVLLTVGLLDGGYPSLTVRAAMDTPRALEGDDTRLRVTLMADVDVGLAELEMGLAPAFLAKGAQRHVVAVRRGRPRTVELHLVPLNWGVLELPTFTIRTRRSSGLFASSVQYRCISTLRVHINEEPARTPLEPTSFRRVVGSHLATERGEGCEIADIRPYQPGDRLQTINWRISARFDEPWVTLRHPDRSTTVVLVLDAHANYASDGQDTLRRSVRAAMGLARLHLNAQDQVGLLLTGQGRRWIRPQLGISHFATIADALLDLSTNDWAEHQHRRERLDRLVPVDAVVIAISPLLNDTFGHLLEPLLARGQQVNVIEPRYELPSGLQVRSRDDNGDPTIARRVFELEQHLRRRALADLGAAVSPWVDGEPIESTLFRSRQAHRGRAVPLRVRR